LAEEEIRRASIRVLRPVERERLVSGERFVGRERELAQLGAALDKTSAGQGRMFLLSGEPGIGKSRLAHEFSTRSQARGVRVIWGRCWERGAVPAYWPIIQIIRVCAERSDFAQLAEALGPGIEQVAALVPEIVRPAPVPGERAGLRRIDPQQARFRLFDAVATLLKCVAQREPLVIVIDDLHDADPATLQMVSFLARALKEAPVMILVTHREAEVERSPELRALFAELARESDELPLRGLSVIDAAGLVRDRTGVEPDDRFLATLHRTTGGNPLFLGGVVQTLMAEGKLEQQRGLKAGDLKLPVNVRSAIARQLSGLSERTNSLLAVAAALGDEFELAPLERVAAALAADIPGCLEEAVAAGIVAAVPESGGRWRFTHALIRAAIYDGTSTADRAQLHKKIGEVFEELYCADLDPHLGELAYHFRLGAQRGDIEKAIDYSMRAGTAAYALFAYEEVVLHWEAAAALQKERGADNVESARLLEDLGAPALLGLEERGVGYLEQALKLYEGWNQAEAAARVHVKIGHALISLNDPALRDFPLAQSHYRSAENQLGEIQNFRLRCSLYVGLSSVAWELMQNDQGFEASRRALEIGERSGDELLWMRGALSHADSLYYTGDLAKAFQLFNQAWQKADELNSTSAAAMAAASACYCHAHVWNPVEGEEWALRELSRSRLEHAPSLRRRLFHNLAHSCVFAGKLNEAKRMLAETPCLLAEANLAFYAGDWSQAESTLLRDLEEQGRRPGRPKQEAFAMLWLGRLHHARSEYSKAENLLCRALAIVQGHHLYTEIDIRSELTVLYADSARSNEAQPHLARLREIINRGEDWRGIAGHVARAEAAVALAEGRFQEAQSHFEAAVEISRRFQVPWDEAEALHRWGRALIATGQHQHVVEKFDAAIEIYERHEAGRCWIDRVMADRQRAVGALDTARAEQVAEKAAHNVFHRQGEYWAISFGGAGFNVKDAKGLQYIARLLKCPGDLVSAIDLAALASEGDSGRHRTADLGDAGEVLDAKARADYKRRLGELREEIERSRRTNDIGATERAEAEYKALYQQLIVAAGLGGHMRRSASHRERARVAVTKSIKTAIESIRACNQPLGRHLGNSISTGHFCCYAATESICWHL
jgi:predicted ATPase